MSDEDLTSDPTLYITIITKPAAYGTAGGHFVNCHKAVSWWRVALLTFNNNNDLIDPYMIIIHPTQENGRVCVQLN